MTNELIHPCDQATGLEGSQALAWGFCKDFGAEVLGMEASPLWAIVERARAGHALSDAERLAGVRDLARVFAGIATTDGDPTERIVAEVMGLLAG